MSEADREQATEFDPEQKLAEMITAEGTVDGAAEVARLKAQDRKKFDFGVELVTLDNQIKQKRGGDLLALVQDWYAKALQGHEHLASNRERIWKEVVSDLRKMTNPNIDPEIWSAIERYGP